MGFLQIQDYRVTKEAWVMVEIKEIVMSSWLFPRHPQAKEIDDKKMFKLKLNFFEWLYYTNWKLIYVLISKINLR